MAASSRNKFCNQKGLVHGPLGVNLNSKNMITRKAGFFFGHQIGTRLGPRVPERWVFEQIPWVFEQISWVLNKFLECFNGNVLSFELFKEKCGFLVELVTKNDEKWGTPGFYWLLRFLEFILVENLKKVPVPWVFEQNCAWVLNFLSFFSLSFCNFVKKKKPGLFPFLY